VQKLPKFFTNALLILSSLYSFLLVTSIFFGVYFLGDTVSYLQYANLGSPLTTFIQHDGLWPPLLSLILNIIFKIPLSMYLLGSLLVAVMLSTYLFFCTAFFQTLTKDWKTSFGMAAFTLLGPVGLIMQSLLSEPLMLVLWMAALFFLAQFWLTSKERWLMGWLLTASLLPLARYLGVVAVGWMAIVLVAKLILDFKKKKFSYSPLLVGSSLVFVWVPLAFYLLRTKVLIGTFLPVRDAQGIETIASVATQFATTIGKDLVLLAPLALLFGLALVTKKKSKSLSFFIIVLFGAAASYLYALFISETKFFVLPYLPSRYIGLAYPFVIGGLVSTGMWLRQQYFSKLPKFFSVVSLVLIAVSFLVGMGSTLRRLQEEMNLLDSTVTDVAWTGDLQKLCDSSRKKYVVAHTHSRNWLAWSYAYLCEGTTAVQEPAMIEKDALVISAYDLESYGVVEENQLQMNNYTTRFYISTQSAVLDVDQVFVDREKFE
jgi:hypothetical protein